MSRQINTSTIWPYAMAVMGLFATSLNAPRSWETIARDHAVTESVMVTTIRVDTSLGQTRLALRATPPQSALPAAGVARDVAGVVLPPVAVPKVAVVETVPDAAAVNTTFEVAAVETKPAPPVHEVPTAGVPVAKVPVAEMPAPEVATIDTSAVALPLWSVPSDPAPSASVPSDPAPPAIAEVAGTDAPPPSITPAPAPRVVAAAGTARAMIEEAPTVYTRLESLAWECHTSQWAGRALELLRRFDADLTTGDVERVVDTMRRLDAEANQLAVTANRSQLSADIRRARHAMVRATDAWRLAVAMHNGTESGLALAQRRDRRRLTERISALAGTAEDGEVASAWREYLMLDVITGLAVPQQQALLEDYRDVVQQTVRRLDGGTLTTRQRAYLSRQRFAALSTELKTWVAEPVDPQKFLARIETYERTRLPSDARLVARDLRNLSSSSDPRIKQLDRRMEQHYRNANLRIAISGELVSRLLPTLPETDEPVRQRIMDADVRGWRHTQTDLSVRLVPDATRLHMILEADGSVTANTHAQSGPATLRNSSAANFHVQKPVLHSAETISTKPASVSVDAWVCLRGVKTDLDIIPLVGGITRHIVEQQALERQGTARQILRRQVVSAVSQRVDELADEKLLSLNRSLQDRFFAPMRGLGLAPEMVETRTDAQRMTVRLRLASDQQLGSHTPRPRAPSDSLLSIQLHDSAINNLIEQFNLEGGTFTPKELKTLVAEKLNRDAEAEEPTANTDNVRITFAKEDPVRIRCEDGLVHVRLAFERFERGRKVWKNVVAQADYRPHVEGFTVRLEREGPLQLAGPTSVRKRNTLRIIFAKILPRQRELVNVIPQSIDTSQTTDLEITQLVLSDGWLGLAVGPRRNQAVALALPTIR